jgi:hypothetical protein
VKKKTTLGQRGEEKRRRGGKATGEQATGEQATGEQATGKKKP